MTTAPTPFHTLLVANRGEIARRIFRTAAEMGFATVAVYADPDADAPFVREADVAVRLPGDTASATYLDADRVIAAARRAGADAVHPGYGFLSEQASFAEAVTAAGLVWVGPPAAAIATMGDKIAAKAVAAAAGVPTLPSAALTGDDPAAWLAAVDAADVGWPLLVKAAAGGGGRGMRLVDAPEGLADAVDTAGREAAASFGDGTVFAERWLAAPRHIEIQVVADRHGAAVHLGERECSIQRRHQKVVEEAPSPAVTPALRDRMGAAALSLVAAIGYEGVGTVELLLDERTGPGDAADFHFLEMNTRLQVEHPVTEEVTGLDLVRLQLEVAAGAPLPITQSEVTWDGHAIEVRVYAEDPAAGWLPSVGTVHRWAPDATPGIRWESGVETGTVVGPQFDPMLAKVVAHAPRRAEAARRLARAVRGLRCEGVSTNLDLLGDVLTDPDFLRGDTTTAFLEQHPPVRHDPLPHPHLVALLAARAEAGRRRSDWAFAPVGWRNGPITGTALPLLAGGEPLEVHHRLLVSPRGTVVAIGDQSSLACEQAEGVWAVEHDSVTTIVAVTAVDDVPTGRGDRTWWLHSALGRSSVTEPSRFPDRRTATAGSGPVAPLPGRVVQVAVSEGDEVEPGETLVVLEAMKVEHRIAAASAARVDAVLVATGDTVDAHQLLVRVTAL